MSQYILCSACNSKCPETSGIKKRYFTTTQYGGTLCSVSCSVSWITKCKIRKVIPNDVDISITGTITTVCSRVRVSSKI